MSLTPALSFGSSAVRFQPQGDRAECGLACLAMVARCYGAADDLRSLRSRFGPVGEGTDLKQLIGWADQLGLNTRPLRLSIRELPALRCPCILHWDFDHFVVLMRAKRNRLTLMDPALGQRSLSVKEAGDHFTGVALELSPGPAFAAAPAPPPPRLRQLLGPTPGLAPVLCFTVALSLVLQLLVLAGPLYLQTVVDDVLVRRDFPLLTVLALGFGLLLLLEVLTQCLRGLVLVQLGTDLGLQLASSLAQRAFRSPVEQFAHRPLGDLISRFRSLEPLQGTISEGVISGLVDGVLALLTLAMLLAYSPSLSLLVLTAALASLGLRLLLLPLERRRHQQLLLAEARADSQVLETLRGYVTVKLLGQEDERRQQWVSLKAEMLSQRQALGVIGVFSGTGQRLLSGIEHLLLIYLGAELIADQVFTAGMLFAFLSYRSRFVQSLTAVLAQFSIWQEFRLHKARVTDLLPADTAASAAAQPLPVGLTARPLAAALAVRGLSLRHRDSSPWLYRNLNFELAPGEVLGITGPSGCGKSSLLQVLLGLKAPTEGEVQIDGRPLCLEEHRHLMSAVLQDDRLLAGSIVQNISGFAAQPNIEAVVQAAATAQIHDEILALPMQYRTPIGEAGAALSGGQLQRLLIARAIYRRPALLLLDEATCHLDPNREVALTTALAALPMTRIIIAHRRETLAICDRVLQLGTKVQSRTPSPDRSRYVAQAPGSLPDPKPG